jgi:peroxiredoxin
MSLHSVAASSDARRQLARRVMVTLLVALTLPLTAYAVKVGDPAPDFTGADSHGQSHKLSEYRGKYVVLEWTNNGCPFTKKHYDSGNMQSLQKEWTAKGVVWLTVISSAPGGQGYMTADQENAYVEKEHASPTAVLLDPQGTIGHEYSARTTPHMFVIDPSGKLVYAGAIDDHATTDPADVKTSKNYVSAALSESMSGKQVSISYTRPYGCSVKYSGGD